MAATSSSVYRRYRIAIRPTPEIVPLSPRFRVRVRKRRLIGLVLKELVQLRGNRRVALDPPCVYGVFSGRLGGLAPRQELCVGCLRCTVQHPDVVRIERNPERGPEWVETLLYEARTGRVPVRGAGYRGRFGGLGWDGLWLDMSEIVRPTRDGIHGREYISTSVDVGELPPFLALEEDRGVPPVLSLRVPFLLEARPAVAEIVADAARELETMAILPLAEALSRPEPHVVPVVRPADVEPPRGTPAMLELEGWSRERFEELRWHFPGAVLAARVPAGADVVRLVNEGARVVHLIGQPLDPATIRGAHERLVDAGVREEVTLLGGGGIVMAEHMAKAIACGLDAVVVDTALEVALQGLSAPPREWGVQRIKNLANAWRDQLLEVLGAMGMREVRHLRGEVGRVMLQDELEEQAFSGVGSREG